MSVSPFLRAMSAPAGALSAIADIDRTAVSNAHPPVGITISRQGASGRGQRSPCPYNGPLTVFGRIVR
jgi:hypothetical protein